MSDETPVERRLAHMWESSAPEIDNKELLMEPEERAAIDCGREAIRLLRAWDDIPHNGDLKAWMRDRVALLSRCTEGPR